MARDLDHLDLPQVQTPIARKRHGGGANKKRSDPSRHAKLLEDQTAEVLRVAARPRPVGARPALIFKLALDAKSDITEENLGRFGLTVVARDEKKVLVVFASDGDLAEFRSRVASYGSPDGPAYGEVGNIEALAPITPEDRTGRRLARAPLAPTDSGVPMDVELWHPGSAADARDRLDELRIMIDAAPVPGRVSDHFVGADLIVVRCHLDAPLVEMLLRTDIVREVDRVPEAAIARVQTIGTTADQLPPIQPAADGAAGVLIIDSGITANHPMLAPAVGDAQVFPEELGQVDGLGPADGDQRLGGHGTAVAGFAAWGKPHEALRAPSLQAEVALFSARVCDADGKYDPDLLVEHQLEAAITYFAANYPECRVVNISLGDDRLVYARGNRQTRLAARIDELAYLLRERGLLFVISAGNFEHRPEAADHQSHVRDYPAYLSGPRAKLIEPATAALALTVGGLSGGGQAAVMSYQAGRRTIAGTLGYPSPFTRTGPGVGAMIKPEFVEQAGDFVYDPAAPAKLVTTDPGAGLPTTNRGFAPPSGRLMRAVAGTSYAAPAVAHAAARLFNRFPDASPNLVRALLADSARLPDDRPDGLAGSHDEETVLNTYGYGQPNFERAAYSATNDALLVAEASIAPDSFQLFEIPFLPSDFMTRGDREISISLAFDPPTRQTRGDSYLGLAMEFHLFRNSSREAVAAAFRDWEAAPAEGSEIMLTSALGKIKGRQKIDLSPGVSIRRRGTLQRGVHRSRSANWDYDGGPLVLAVSCLRKWAPPEVSLQPYAVVVSLRHSDPRVDLHAPIRARLQPRQRARIR